MRLLFGPSILAAVTTSVRCFLVACLLAGSGLEDRSLVSLTKASVEKHCSSEHGSGLLLSECENYGAA